MAEQDAAIEVRSPIERFIDAIINNEFDSQTATISELTLTSLLTEIDDNSEQSGQILGCTLAAYHMKDKLTVNKIY